VKEESFFKEHEPVKPHTAKKSSSVKPPAEDSSTTDKANAS